MKINQVCKQLNMTKKAISYYEKQGLIEVPKDENGYRNFNLSHIKSLNEIILFRKLNISTANISHIMQSASKKDVLESIANDKKSKMREMVKHQSYLEKMLLSELNEALIEKTIEEISESERDDPNFILIKLSELFPNGYGLILSNHFVNFKFDMIKTKEQNDAWMAIVKFLDEVDEIEISDVVLSILDDKDIDKVWDIHNKMKLNVLKEDLDIKTMNFYKTVRDDTFNTIKELSPKIHHELIEFQKTLKAFFGSENYKKNVIKNIEILSEEYKEYQIRLNALGQKIL